MPDHSIGEAFPLGVDDLAGRDDEDPSRPTARSEGYGLGRYVETGALCAGLFLLLTLPRVHWGPVIGTGQDDWYNVVRGLRALYERLNPTYFIHPALYYEFLAVLSGLASVWLSVTGKLA